MKLTPIEQETIVLFNEGEDIASLYTYNKKLQQRFDKLAAKHPETVSRKDNGHGAVTYEFPKKPLVVSFQSPVSETEKQRRADNMRKNRYVKKANGSNGI